MRSIYDEDTCPICGKAPITLGELIDRYLAGGIDKENEVESHDE